MTEINKLIEFLDELERLWFPGLGWTASKIREIKTILQEIADVKHK